MFNAIKYSKYGKYTSKIIRRLDKVTGIYRKMENNIKMKRNSIEGHTILAVYEKY
jgi:hypothetical protein